MTEILIGLLALGLVLVHRRFQIVGEALRETVAALRILKARLELAEDALGSQEAWEQRYAMHQSRLQIVAMILQCRHEGRLDMANRVSEILHWGECGYGAEHLKENMLRGFR